MIVKSERTTLDKIVGIQEKKKPVEEKKKPVEEKKKPVEEKKPEAEKEDSEALRKLVRRVLSPHEVLRDPIHGDIWINLLERAIIDTTLFQNLRGKLQLGTTHLVYPGATHTRFAHSIGTLHMANEIVEICNENYRKYTNPDLIEIPPYHILIIRLFALLHDAAHLPFGHTMEREGNLFSKHEWEDKTRADKILGKESDIRKAITDTLLLFGFSEEQIEKIINDLYTVLTYEHDKDSMDFDIPYIIDIVGNTLCADLLDYALRDIYYCGLSEKWGDRFLRYLAILPLAKIDSKKKEFEVTPTNKGGKGRLVLLSYRYELDRAQPTLTRLVPKPDVLSEAIDLLRKRYSLAQKVYFHRTKKAASAMIISAVKEEGLKPDGLLDMNCDQLVAQLNNSANERVKNIAQNYSKRNLYKVIYEIKYKEEKEDDKDSRKLWRVILPKFRNCKKRIKMEREVEKDMNLGLGNLVIYCPRRGMNVKQIEMLVQTAPQYPVKPLSEILDEVRKEEMNVIDKYFNRLWALQVLVNPSVLDPSEVNNSDVRCLSGYCEELFGLPNDLREELRGTKRDYLSARIHFMVKEWDEKHPKRSAPYHVVEKIKAQAHRYSKDPEALKKQFHKLVREHYEKE